MFIRRGRRLEILSKDQIYRIHLASIEILENIGVKINHEEALRMLDRLGVYVNYKSKNVKISESIVREALKKIPSEFTYYGRKTKLDVKDDYVYYLSGGSPLKVMDLNGNIRNATLKDLS
ncbi:MAG: trimethylamine methyltransferase family protein, partial [Candidatus Methanomethylicia archaeon]